MKHSTLLVWCAVFALSLWGPRALAAKPAKQSAPASAGASTGTPSTALKPGSADLRRARYFVTWLMVRSDHIQSWLRVSRQRHERGPSRCLDSKLSQAHAVERHSQTALRAVEAAVKSGRPDELEPQMARLQIYDEHSRRLLKQASACRQATARGSKLTQSRSHVRRLR